MHLCSSFESRDALEMPGRLAPFVYFGELYWRAARCQSSKIAGMVLASTARHHTYMSYSVPYHQVKTLAGSMLQGAFYYGGVLSLVWWAREHAGWKMSQTNDGDCTLVRDGLLFWVNALDIGNCMLSHIELADGRILLEIGSLESMTAPAATRRRVARGGSDWLLGRAWFRKAAEPLDAPGSASKAIAAANVDVICALLQYVRALHPPTVSCLTRAKPEHTKQPHIGARRA